MWTLPLAVALLGLLAADGRASPLELRFATKPLRFEPLPAPPDRPVYATLDAHLAETPAWEYRRKLVKARLTIDDPALAVRELQLVGLPMTDQCSWVLAARAEVGWLGSIGIGVSKPHRARRGNPCASTLGLVEAARFSDFPTGLVRLEGAPVGMAEVEVAFTTIQLRSPDGNAPERFVAEANVLRCRIDATAIACAEVAADSPLAAANLGSEVPAKWLALPGTLAARYGSSYPHTLASAPFASGTLTFSGGGRAGTVIWQPPGGPPAKADLWRTSVPEDRSLVRVASEPGGVVRFSFTGRAGRGGTSLVQHWDELFVPPSGARGPLRVRLVTGATLSDGGGADDAPGVAGWARQVEVEADGVRIVEMDGPLAWFRGTGRYTWDELARVVPRWRDEAGRAINREAVRVLETRPRRSMQDFNYDRALDLLPGYVEPLGVDENLAGDQFKRLSIVYLDEFERFSF